VAGAEIEVRGILASLTRTRDNIAMVDLSGLWDFGDPAASEKRFRDAAATAPSPDAEILMTQVARALGLQDRFDDAHAVLDALASDATLDGIESNPTSDPEVAVRLELERGRLYRSAGDATAATPHFAMAAAAAERAGLAGLHVDALHMLAIVAPADQQVAAHERALEVARSSDDEAARSWVPSLLNNLGMTYSDAGEWDAALDVFEQALAEREKGSDAEAIRIARWMVAWTLRNLGRRDEARTMQLALKDELVTLALDDPYVDEELELLRES
jgi:tetratricopeptide (TPR) repeat protein